VRNAGRQTLAEELWEKYLTNGLEHSQKRIVSDIFKIANKM
jgi:hypothetical protein